MSTLLEALLWVSLVWPIAWIVMGLIDLYYWHWSTHAAKEKPHPERLP